MALFDETLCGRGRRQVLGGGKSSHGLCSAQFCSSNLHQYSHARHVGTAPLAYAPSPLAPPLHVCCCLSNGGANVAFANPFKWWLISIRRAQASCQHAVFIYLQEIESGTPNHPAVTFLFISRASRDFSRATCPKCRVSDICFCTTVVANTGAGEG